MSTKVTTNNSNDSREEELLSQLSFYGAYHNNPYNQLIHILFVPVIQWGLVLGLNYFGTLIQNDFLESIHLDLTLGTFVIFGYQLYYLYLGEYFVSGTYDVFLLLLLMHANATFKSAGTNFAWVHVLWSQVVGWGLQVVVGHNMIEKRKPALLDALFDSLIMAPLFTFWEVLFYFGYKKDFKAKLDVRIQKNIKILDAGEKITKKA